MEKLRGAAFIAAWLAAIAPAAAQQAPPKPDEQPPDKPKPKPAEARGDKPDLQAALEDLRGDFEDLEDDNKDLQEQLDELREATTTRSEPVRLNLLNPPITAFANAAARIDDGQVRSAEGTEIDDKLFLRTAEVDFRAAIDPYADGVIILAFEDQAGEGFEADLEEVYMVLKRLPIVESAPLGLKLKIGRYRAPIGSVNRLHMHDLPWTTRPLPIAELLGTEQGDFFESGYNPEGIDADFLLPEIIPGAVMELNLDLVDGGDAAISGGGQSPGYLGHLNLFFTAADTHDFNFGASAFYEAAPQHAGLLAADFLYKWKPLESGEFHSLVLGGEVLYADRNFEVDVDGDGMPDGTASTTPLGLFGFAQYQLSWHTYAGVRYDYAQSRDDDSVATQVAAAYLTYYTSEFLRFRVGYEHRFSDVAELDGLDSVFLEANMVIGSHPIEPYWVNR